MQQELDIRKYLKGLMRGWWIILLLGVAAGAVTYLFTPKMPPRFESSVSLLFEGDSRTTSTLPYAANYFDFGSLDAQAQSIRSPQVLRRAALKVVDEYQSVNGSNELVAEIRSLGSSVSTRQFNNTNVVVITASAPEAELAVVRANAVAEAYIEQATEDQTLQISKGLDSISRQIDTLQRARNEAYTVDPQSLTDLEQRLTSMEGTIFSVLDRLEELGQAGDESRLSLDVLSSISDKLATVASDLELVQANLILVQDRKYRESDNNAVSQISKGFILAADALDRATIQLSEVTDRASQSGASQASVTIEQIQKGITATVNSLNQTVESLDQVQEQDTQLRASHVQPASDSVTSAANSIRSAESRVSQVLKNPGPLVNQSQLQAVRDQFAKLDSDIKRLVPQILDLSEGSGAASEGQERQLIVNQIGALRTKITVVIPDLQLQRSREDNPLNIGSLITAEEHAQQSLTSLNVAITEIQLISQASGTSIGGLTLAEIKEQFTNLSEDIGDLTTEVRELGQASSSSELRQLQLAAKVTALQASLDTLVLEIQARRVSGTSSADFVPLFIAEVRAKEGVTALTGLIGQIDSLAVAPQLPASLSTLPAIEEDMAAIASDLRDLEFELGNALARGSLSDEQREQFLDRLSVQDAALDLAVQQLRTVLASQTANIDTYGSIRTAEERSVEASQSLTSLLIQVSNRAGTPTSNVGAAQLGDLQARTGSVASSLLLARSDLENVLVRLESGEKLELSSLTSIQDRIAASSDTLTSVRGDAQLFRSQETDLDINSQLRGNERQLQAAMTALIAVSDGIAQLQSRPSNEISNSLNLAAFEGLKARDTFVTALQSLDARIADIDTGVMTPPIGLVGLSQEFDTLATNLETISLELLAAQQIETIPVIKQEITAVVNGIDASRTFAGDSAAHLESLSQPSTAETSLYTQLLDSQRQLQLGRVLFDEQNVRIMSPAVVARHVTDSSLLTSTALGAVAGLLLGVVAVLFQEFLDRRLRTQDDLRRHLGLPTLGAIPKAEGVWNPHPQIRPDSPPSLFSESLRMVRTGLEVNHQDASSAKVLLITSPRENEGKTTVALNLARSIAVEHRKVLLIDGNLRNPDIASAFKLESSEGLTTALGEMRDPAEFIVEVEGVHVLPAGPARDNPVDLLSSAAFARFLQDAKNEYDNVIIDSPPVLGFADTVLLARRSDGAIFVYRADRTVAGSATQANEIIRATGVKVVGTVLNMASRRATGVKFKNYGSTGKRTLWDFALRFRRN